MSKMKYKTNCTKKWPLYTQRKYQQFNIKINMSALYIQKSTQTRTHACMHSHNTHRRGRESRRDGGIGRKTGKPESRKYWETKGVVLQSVLVWRKLSNNRLCFFLSFQMITSAIHHREWENSLHRRFACCSAAGKDCQNKRKARNFVKQQQKGISTDFLQIPLRLLYTLGGICIVSF